MFDKAAAPSHHIDGQTLTEVCQIQESARQSRRILYFDAHSYIC